MTDESREPIIDSLLEEYLGKVSPPDLTQRILSKQQESGSRPAIGIELGKASRSRSGVSPRRPERRSNWNGWITVAIVLIAATGFSVWALRMQKDLLSANRGPTRTTVPEQARTRAPQPVVQPAPKDRYGASADSLAANSAERDLPSTPVQADEQIAVIVPPDFERAGELGKPSSDERVVSFIDGRLQRVWKRRSVTPVGSVDDLVWFRRASHYLIGRRPTQSEERVFLRDRDREGAIQGLMAQEQFAQHWASVFTNVLVGSASENNKRFDRQQLQTYLAQSIAEEKPYDQLAYELISAVGSTDSEAADFNPATNFLLAHQGVERVNGKPDPAKRIVATDKICQVFLGKQIQCAQCHDHESVKQEHYYGLTAFLAQMRAVGGAGSATAPRLFNDDFSGSDGSFVDADVTYTLYPSELGAVAYPKFLDGSDAPTKSGRVAEFDRRTELAKLVVEEDEFSRAIINRLWDLAFASGFTRPVDDMGSHNPPSHPELLNRLAVEFKNSGYNMKSALRWITRSRAFGLRVRSLSDPLGGQPDSFSSFARRDSGNKGPIGQSLLRIARARAESGDHFDRDIVFANEGALLPQGAVSPDQLAKRTQYNNAKLREQVLRIEEGSLLHRIANSRLTNRQKVTHLFLATVGRRPRGFELRQGVQVLEHGTPLLALRDVGFTLLCSEEYLTQH